MFTCGAAKKVQKIVAPPQFKMTPLSLKKGEPTFAKKCAEAWSELKYKNLCHAFKMHFNFINSNSQIMWASDHYNLKWCTLKSMSLRRFFLASHAIVLLKLRVWKPRRNWFFHKILLMQSILLPWDPRKQNFIKKCLELLVKYGL